MACYTLQITQARLASERREVPLTELLSTYLRAVAPSAYCDLCLAAAVQEPLEPVHHTTEALTSPGQFARKHGRCRICRSTKRIVTRVDPGRHFQPGPRDAFGISPGQFSPSKTVSEDSPEPSPAVVP